MVEKSLIQFQKTTIFKLVDYFQKITIKKWIILMVFGITLTSTLTYFIGVKDEENTAVLGDIQENMLAIEPVPPAPIPEDAKEVAILLLGYGGAGHQGGMLSDVIQIAHINFEKKMITLISIPRDLAVTLPELGEQKINTAFSLNQQKNAHAEGATFAKQMAQAVTGIPIHYYIAVDFNGFKRLVGEEMGGITVNVTEELDDPWYPIAGKEQEACGYTAEEIAEITRQYSGFELEKQFPCRYEHIHFPVGEVVMEGGDALAFVRSRHGSIGGDFSRSKRQWAVLLGIKDSIKSRLTSDSIDELYEALSNHVSTDLDLQFIKKLSPSMLSDQDFSVQTVGLSTENVLISGKNSRGQFVLYPKNSPNDWETVHKFVREQASFP